LDFTFQEESLEDKLYDTLKELKIKTTNEGKVDRAMFQSDWVLAQLKQQMVTQ
jgi:hypothetical protein